MQFSKKAKYIVLSLALLVASFNTLRTLRDILQNSKRLHDAEAEVLALREERALLEEAVEVKESSAYIEEIARNELNLVKPGEDVYVYPDVKDIPIKKPAVDRAREFTEQQRPLDEWLDLLF